MGNPRAAAAGYRVGSPVTPSSASYVAVPINRSTPSYGVACSPVNPSSADYDIASAVVPVMGRDVSRSVIAMTMTGNHDGPSADDYPPMPMHPVSIRIFC